MDRPRALVAALLLIVSGIAQLLPNTVPLVPGLGTVLSLGSSALTCLALVLLGTALGRTGGAVIVAGALTGARLHVSLVLFMTQDVPGLLFVLADVAAAAALVAAAVVLAATRSVHGAARWALAIPAAAKVLVIAGAIVLTLHPALVLPWIGEASGAAWVVAGVALLLSARRVVLPSAGRGDGAQRAGSRVPV